ncbi:MAG TPA: helicase-related protein, partial [Nevskiaceae bacterium]|nr:helicase-related protein [Nevskiaceae bacterium]
NRAADTVNQRVIHVHKGDKAGLLAYMISRGNWRQTLVFTRTKHGANRLAERLLRDGITTAALHGNKSQNARTKALAALKAGEVRVLVATDIAARGLDIDQLPHVVNYELPNVPEDYVHRIGRTGRAGATGEAVSLVGPEERGELKDIERLLKKSIPTFEVEGYVPGPRQAEEPRPPQQHRQGRRRGGGRPGGEGRGHGHGQRHGHGGRDHRGGQASKPQHHSGGRHK